MIVSIFAFWGCQKGINLDDVSIPNRSSQTNLAIQIAEEVGIMHNEGLDYCYSKLNAINNIEFVFEDSLKMLLDREIKLYADSYIASKRYDFSDVFCSNIDNNISVTLNKVFNDSLPTLIFQNRVQAMYYDSIISIVENELLSYNDVLLYLNTLKENVINNFSNQEDLLVVLVGIEVAKNSYIYWYNDVKWKSLLQILNHHLIENGLIGEMFGMAILLELLVELLVDCQVVYLVSEQGLYWEVLAGVPEWQ